MTGNSRYDFEKAAVGHRRDAVDLSMVTRNKFHVGYKSRDVPPSLE